MYHPINNYKLTKLMMLQSFMRPVMLVFWFAIVSKLTDAMGMRIIKHETKTITSTIYEFLGDVVVLLSAAS